MPAFVLVVIADPLGITGLFLLGNFLIGFGAALFGHCTLTATMNRAPEAQAGLALGAWGAVQATAAGVAVALSGTIRDLVTYLAARTGGVFGLSEIEVGYFSVYALEVVLLVVTIVASLPLIRGSARSGFQMDGATPSVDSRGTTS